MIQVLLTFDVFETRVSHMITLHINYIFLDFWLLEGGVDFPCRSTDEYWRLCEWSCLPLSYGTKEVKHHYSFAGAITSSQLTNPQLRLAGTKFDPLFHIVGCGLLSLFMLFICAYAT